jgi:hypothetical protein
MSQERQSEKSRGSPEPRAKAPRPQSHRTYGYRGYGSGFGRGTGQYGGAVHWGTGFGGVGSPSYGGSTLPRAGFFTSEVWEPGRYAGLSPKGYSRSDDRIQEDICDDLTRRADIDPSQLTVSVQDGEVTLAGTVEDIHARSLADEIASRCAGVKQVHNEIRVSRPRSNGR